MKGKLSMIQSAAWVVGTGFAVVVGTWTVTQVADDRYASAKEFVIAAGQTNILWNAELAQLMKQRAELQAKKNKTAQDLKDIEYLNKQIEYMQAVQEGRIKK